MKKKIIFSVIIILIIYGLGGILYHQYFKEEEIEIKNIDSIDNYPYVLKSNATSAMKDEFNNLKKILEKETVDEKDYASSITKLFIIDLYTLKNKLNKYDVGGTDYIYPPKVDNYKLKVTDTLYKYLEEKTKERTKDLPEVKNVNIINIEETLFNYNEEEYSGYIIEVSIEYEKDFGYDKEGTITVIKENDLYYIAEIQNKDEA